ncbi:FUSC family protein [Streptomyces sp. NPDC049813]|uniref:FUSC family protein n=1 Tax=Streptomyces sp. NPDC049813 TaxID=3365597 RepID=UPI0037B9F71D
MTGPAVRWLPPPGLVARAAALVLAAVVPVVVAWWLLEGGIAQSVYLGMTFMTVAAGRLTPVEQCAAGLCAGLAAAAGTLVAGHTPALLVAVAAACAAQAAFNRRSAGTAALLPSNLVLYAALAPDHPWSVAAATWLGAGIVIVLAAVLRLRLPASPASAREVAVHAAELTIGCVALILLSDALDLPRGNWAVLTLCLVFVPAVHETRARVLHRALGTVLGAVAAVAVAVVAPSALCFVLAALCAVLTVAYALLPDDLLYAAFLTPTVLLLFSSGRAHATVEVAVERVEMTAVGGALALALTWAAAWWLRRGPGPAAP